MILINFFLQPGKGVHSIGLSRRIDQRQTTTCTKNKNKFKEETTRMNKKILALLLAFAMMFSTITVAFADESATIGADAEALETMGVIQGETGVVTPEYLAKETTRMQAAIMYLRLRGLEDEALAFTGTANFPDASTMVWGGGKAVMAYLKANPQLGWIGADGGKFNPFEKVTAQQYYKVMLEALGYKQTTDEAEGDFTWSEVLTFAAEKGLTKVAAVTSFTNNDLAIATMEALKLNVKGGTKTLAVKLVDDGMINKEAAIEAGLYAEDIAVAVKEAKALGNSVVQVKFEDEVGSAAENADNYTIEGLEVKSAAISAEDTVRLETAAMTSGKVYKLTVGEKTVQFTGIAKVSDGPEIDSVKSEDVEEVVIDFNKNVDLATATDVANYSINGVEIVKAEVDEDEVTLTTEGLQNKIKYTVKATNIKSVDGVTKRTNTESFTVRFDTNAPKIDGDIEVQTNERIVVKFNEKVTKESAENIDNYSIKVDETNGSELDIVSVTWDSDSDDQNNVEIVTEPMEKREDYKLTINNIADQRKAANVMTRPATKTFKAVAEDEKAPVWKSLTVLSPTTILVEFTDGSKIDETSVLDLSNYELEDLNVESVRTIKNEWKTFRAILTVEEMETGKTYDLTIVDILDEFGNAMKEDTKPAKAISSNLASAKLLSAVATGKNAVTLKFDKEVDETTAENIANYTIDEEVGAPTKATLQDDGVTVKLEVNDIVNGYKEYDIIVDGVEDLAGNDLYYKMKIDTVSSPWDTTAPELEDADAISNKVVALTFDEKVTYESDAELVLAVNGVDNDATNVKLAARGYAEDNTVVEFSSSTALDTDKDYTVVAIVYNDGADDGGVKDLAGNRVLESSIAFGDFTFEGIDDELEAAEVDSYEQVNGKTFEVIMSKDVAFVKDVDTTDIEGFTVTIDKDDENIVKFTKNSGKVIEDTDYEFNFADFLTDRHGNPVENADDDDLTILTGEYTDTDAPEIESIVAINRETIEITFSEDIPVMDTAAKTAFIKGLALMNYDLDSSISVSMDDDNAISDNDGDNVIKVKVGKAMEARYEYELTVKKGSFKDFVGIANENDDTFYFDGTNLAK
jgi:hypothetical protein